LRGRARGWLGLCGCLRRLLCRRLSLLRLRRLLLLCSRGRLLGGRLGLSGWRRRRRAAWLRGGRLWRGSGRLGLLLGRWCVLRCRWLALRGGWLWRGRLRLLLGRRTRRPRTWLLLLPTRVDVARCRRRGGRLRDDHRLLRRCRGGDRREQDRDGTKKDASCRLHGADLLNRVFEQRNAPGDVALSPDAEVARCHRGGLDAARPRQKHAALRWRMIFSENRCPLFGIMRGTSHLRQIGRRAGDVIRLASGLIANARMLDRIGRARPFRFFLRVVVVGTLATHIATLRFSP